jgi:predicted AAA+ superfamily ATPase
METSYLIHRLPAWHVNIRKQVVKASKLHFFDSGLVCYLLGIHEPEQLRLPPLRGAIFESWVFSEIFKTGVPKNILENRPQDSKFPAILLPTLGHSMPRSAAVSPATGP